MRLIDADALKDRVGYIEEEYGHIMEEINNAPTVKQIKVGDVCKECWRDGGNVVEVVRCKDCVHYRKSDKWHPDTDWCKRLICGTVKPDFFCADGERRTE